MPVKRPALLMHLKRRTSASKQSRRTLVHLNRRTSASKATSSLVHPKRRRKRTRSTQTRKPKETKVGGFFFYFSLVRG